MYRIYYTRTRWASISSAWYGRTEEQKDEIIKTHKRGYLTILQLIGKRYLVVEKYSNGERTFKRKEKGNENNI